MGNGLLSELRNRELHFSMIIKNSNIKTFLFWIGHYVLFALEMLCFDCNTLSLQKDGRIPTHPGFKWSVTADVESLAWDPHSNHSFVVCASSFHFGSSY